jgi:hypothetical protein
MNIIVYTALFGNIDPLWAAAPHKTQARFVVFTDTVRQEVGQWGGNPPRLSGGAQARPARWEQRVAPAEYGARRTARYYKCNPHLFFPDADVSIWVDSNVRLRLTPEQAVARWLKHDLATFKHPDRDCVYREARACVKMRKDDRAILEGQAAVYRAVGMPARWGLAETRVVIRRHTAAIAQLNDAWWQEIVHYSQRDQIAFPFTCWRLGTRWDVIPGRVLGDKNPHVWHTNHRKG